MDWARTVAVVVPSPATLVCLENLTQIFTDRYEHH
jgi:hypothetical protein